MSINIPPDGKGSIVLICWVMLAGIYRECELLDANAGAQTVHVRTRGSLFTITAPWRDVQNVALKYSNGEVLQNFGAPRPSNPGSLDFIQYSTRR